MLQFSVSQLLQTESQLVQAERDRDEFTRKLHKFNDQRRLEALRDLQDATVRLASTKARLKAASEKLLYTSTMRSQLVQGQGSKPQIALYRKSEGGVDRLAADEDTLLAPGDTVEVTLQLNLPN